MSNTKEVPWSKGPWSVSPKTEHGCCWAVSVQGPDFVTLPDGQVMDWKPMVAECGEEDAALIAAAPEMAELLEETAAQLAGITEMFREVLGIELTAAMRELTKRNSALLSRIREEK